MTINNVWNWGDPVIGVHRTYLSTNNVGVIWTNNTGYNNADVDALLAQAGAEYDFDTRVDLYGQAQEIISQDVPIVYLTTPPFWQAFQRGSRTRRSASGVSLARCMRCGWRSRPSGLPAEDMT